MALSALQIVHLSVLLYAVCFMAQAPLLPYLTKQLGASSDTAYGWLQSFFSGLQFFGTLLSGPFVDRHGGKVLLVVSYLSSAACYALTASAQSLTMLYLSRLASIMQHAVLAARTIITFQTSDAERAAQLGYIGAAYGVGFAIGPALGGQLSSYSLQTTAWAAAAASLLGALAIQLLLPSDRQPGAAKGKADHSSSSSSSRALSKGPSLSSIWDVCSQPGVPQLLLFKGASALCLAVLSSTFTLMLKNHFHLDSKANGWVLSYLGACMVFAQAILIKPVQRWLGEAGCVTWGCFVMAGSFLGIGLINYLWELLIMVLPLMCAGVIVATVNTAQLTKAVPVRLQGTLLAVDMSLGSGVRMVSPILGTQALSRIGYFGTCATLGGLLLLLALQQLLLARGPLERRGGSEGGSAGKEQQQGPVAVSGGLVKED